MTKLYMAFAIFDYEGGKCLGVFTSRKKAQDVCDASISGNERKVFEVESNVELTEGIYI